MKYPELIFKLLASGAAGCVLVMLSGCFSIVGNGSQSLAYYTLEPVAGPSTELNAEESLVVGLGRLTVPDYLDRKEIVVRTGSNRLRYTNVNLWAERSRESVSRVLALNIVRQSNEPVQVHPLPWSDYVNPEYIVRVEIHALEGQETPEPQVLVDISWAIQSMPARATLKENNYRSREISWTPSDYSELAEKLSTELAVVGRMISMDLAAIGGAPEK